MDNIIQFKMPQKKSIEDQFLDSLDDEQQEMFHKILVEIQEEFDKLQGELVRKIAESEMLRIENESLKGGRSET